MKLRTEDINFVLDTLSERRRRRYLYALIKENIGCGILSEVPPHLGLQGSVMI